MFVGVDHIVLVGLLLGVDLSSATSPWRLKLPASYPSYSGLNQYMSKLFCLHNGMAEKSRATLSHSPPLDRPEAGERSHNAAARTLAVTPAKRAQVQVACNECRRAKAKV